MPVSQPIEVEGVAAVRLSSPGARLKTVVVPSAGMLIYSLKRGESEFLNREHSLDDYIHRGKTIAIPLLHPWANRLPSLSYSAAGKEVELDPDTLPIRVIEGTRPIHGMRPGELPWEVGEAEVRAGHTRLEGRAVFDETLPQFSGFPFTHALIFLIELSDEALRVTVTVEVPADEQRMPVAFGFHPYLRLPETDRSQWEMSLPFSEQVDLEDQMPTGSLTTIGPITGKLTDRTFDDGYIAPGQPLGLRDSEHALTMTMDAGYRYAQIYTPRGAQFICYEPMTASVDPFNTPGTPLVKPGSSYSATFVLALSAASADKSIQGPL